jgi:cytochrome c oxidase subunit 2
MNAGQAMRLGIGLMAMLATGVAAAADAQPWQLNMTPGRHGDLARGLLTLHNLGAVAFAWSSACWCSAPWAMRCSRSASPRVRSPAQFSHNTLAEVIWTVIPILILVAMAWPATKTLIRMYDTTRIRDDGEGHRLPVDVEATRS